MVPLTRHGFREMLIGSLVLVAVAVGLGYSFWWPVSIVVLPVLIWLFAFFRDPERKLPTEQHAMVSPADGTVSDVTELPHHDLLGGPCDQCHDGDDGERDDERREEPAGPSGPERAQRDPPGPLALFQ